MSACTVPVLLMLLLSSAAANSFVQAVVMNSEQSKMAAAAGSSSSAEVSVSAILDHQQEHGNQKQQQQQSLNVPLVRRSLAAAATAEASSADAQVTGIPVYGNWCGPSYGSGTPIDAIDDCCRDHDNCYDSTAVYNHCNCDRNLVRCLNKVDIPLHHFKKRAMRATIVTYFDNTFCRCSMEADMCMPGKNCFCLSDG